MYRRREPEQWAHQRPQRQRNSEEQPLFFHSRMSASEQLFFLGAPLAHVVRYEDELRAQRSGRASELERARRLYL